ncbi:MAG: hypothetical protein ACTSYI_05715 [Promethearchaeota archaeon]
MSKWPQLCVRCGENNKNLLSEQKFRWKYLIMLSQSQSQESSQSKDSALDVSAFICQHCIRVGRIRWISIFLISLLGSLFGFMLVFGAFGGIILEGLIILLPSLGVLIFTLLMRRQVSRYYAHFYYANGWIRGFFRSVEYKKAFDASFPDGIYMDR